MPPKKKPPASVFVPRAKPKKPAAATPFTTTNKLRPTFESNFDDRVSQNQRSDLDFGALPALYEGTYASWRKEAELLLIKNKLWSIAAHATHPDPDPSTRAAWTAASKEALRIVKRYVRPGVMERVPAERQEDLNDLFEALRGVAAPFRLMDLPAELRVRIYEFAVRRAEPILLLRTDPFNTTKEVESVPPLLQVSRQVRLEASQTYYSINQFSMELNHQDSHEIIHYTVPFVQKWYQRSGVPFKHLRQLTVSTTKTYSELSTPGERTITVRYMPGIGLDVTPPDALNTIGLAKIEKHAKAIEQYRRANDLEGEAVALFFCLNAELRFAVG